MSSYREFFEAVTGFPPYPYQERLGTGEWPDVIDIPTGLGKTAAVVVGWMWRRRTDPSFPRRLVFCLPMRTLVRQTEKCIAGWLSNAERYFASEAERPTVHVLLGGDVDASWDVHPEQSAILVGTQDMLLSRALNRGYAMSRYRWPVHFGLLNNDVLWVLDETQLMGVGVETSAQLQAFRDALGVYGEGRTTWMSATLGREQLATVDHDPERPGWSVCSLGPEDRASARVVERTDATKSLRRIDDVVLREEADRSAAAELAKVVLGAHKEGSLTLVVVNRVPRAIDLYQALLAAGRTSGDTALIHSRYRPPDRAAQEAILHGSGDRIVVATQAIEAGVDVSAMTLVTELAPWPSLVQRFGRCNRDGRVPDAKILWVDMDNTEIDGALALPYLPEELRNARALLEGLSDVGPRSLSSVTYSPPRVVRPVLRRRDLLELFDTTPDLCGKDIDVSRFIRDGEDSDVMVYWRDWEDAPDGDGKVAPEELCRVSIAAFSKWVGKAGNKAGVFEWVPLEGAWRAAFGRVRPGGTYAIAMSSGGYSEQLGWTGNKTDKPSLTGQVEQSDDVTYDSDELSRIGRWVELREHLVHVAEEAERIVERLPIDPPAARAITVAARWHDVGKAHIEFQRKLRPESFETLWAKSPKRPKPDRRSDKPEDSNAVEEETPPRKYFRHELASALAWWRWAEGREDRALIGYLIASHHGKVRVSIRSMPKEVAPADPSVLYARGVWTGDLLPSEGLPSIEVPSGPTLDGVVLDLSPMRMGEGSWLEHMLGLRDSDVLGPFRLAYLESALRSADARASAQEAS